MTSPSRIPADMRYLFDLNGYVVVPNVFSPEDVRIANEVLDAKMASASERVGDVLRNTEPNTPMAGDGIHNRIDLGQCLEWGRESAVFRQMLDHPKLVPYYHEFLGRGYRLDHMPLVIAQEMGAEGFSLHGGTINCRSGEYVHELAYTCTGINGTIRNQLIAASLVLTDHPEGSGGFCVVRGSHKSNFKIPDAMITGEAYQEFVYQPVLHAGDVLIFSEGTVHGALPWTKDYQRRIALFRFSPSTVSYSRSYLEEGIRPTADVLDESKQYEDDGFGGRPAALYEGMSPAQLAVLQPPFANRVDRRVIDDTGGVQVVSRSEDKKAFDKVVFGTHYF